MKHSWIYNCRAVFCGATILSTNLSFGKIEPENQVVPKVQIALLLDTSSSMDGLISQAKSQLWRVCNTFIEAKYQNQQPIVEIALYEYGNDKIDSAAQWVRLIEPFTCDLDEVSRELFELRTNGGEEYCGTVIQRSITDLKWDTSTQTYKVIFIAGNESFLQGSINPLDSCMNASKKNIIVNRIYCGQSSQGTRERWNDIPRSTTGLFLSINAEKKVKQIDAPQDQEIAKLNEAINQTYHAYGSDGNNMKARQMNCDQQARDIEHSGAIYDRCITKASKNYDNRNWDIVDAVKTNQIDLAAINKKHLPKEMQEMSANERIIHVTKMENERKLLQEKILELGRQRELYLQEHRTKNQTEQEQTLDQALIEAVRDQAKKIGYTFGN